MASPDSSLPTGDGGDAQDSPQTGVASVVVSSDLGQYVPNASVVFYKPDGSINTIVKTDATGRASATIERSSYVAVVNEMSYARVQGAIANPGDTLRFGPDSTSEEPNGSVRVTWPARNGYGYTVYYRAKTPCGFSAETTFTAATIPLAKGCSSDPFDVVVTSRLSSHQVDAVMSRHDVQATGGLVTVNLADNGGVWKLAGDAAVSLTNLPNASFTPHTTKCTAYQFLESLYVFGAITSTSQTSCSVLLMPEPQSTWVVEASYERNDQPRFAVQMRNTFPHGTSATIDGANSLPWITSFAFDRASRRLTWTSDQDATLDVSSVRLDFRSDARTIVWRIAAPNGLPKTFTLPPLPPDFAMYEPQPTDVISGELFHFDYVGVTTSEVLQRNLYDLSGFPDKPRRGATARTQ